MSTPELRINQLDLVDIGPFPRLNIKFQDKPGINLVCGDNGVGKTTILEAITAAFTLGKNHRIKRRQAGAAGTLQVRFTSGGHPEQVEHQITAFDPKSGEMINPRHVAPEHLIHIRAARDIPYYQQESITRDPEFDTSQFRQRAAADLSSNQIKSWFTNRYLLEPHSRKSSWTNQMIENLNVAKGFFSVLDKDVSLAEVNVTNFEIMISTPNGVIPFEMMSSGFRSTYYLLLSIVKEIEFRRLNTSASKFSGVILVDEIDLHLHPTWQQEIGRILTNSFPMAQIIATTHSPHVVQTTEATDVISLRRMSDGEIEEKKLSTGRYGYKGWTIEEILEEVMGVQNTRTEMYRDALRSFDIAIDHEDSERVLTTLELLREMLHPQNPLRKLIEIQSAPFLVDDRRDIIEDD